MWNVVSGFKTWMWGKGDRRRSYKHPCMLQCCGLFPSHSTAVSENMKAFDWQQPQPQREGCYLKSSRLEPIIGEKVMFCPRSRVSLCLTLLVDHSPLQQWYASHSFTFCQVMHPGSQQAPRKHFFRNLHSSICRWVSCQMIKYYAVYYKTLVCVFVSKAPYFVRSCRCKQATLQKPDASSNCWPSVEGAPTRTVGSFLCKLLCLQKVKVLCLDWASLN